MRITFHGAARQVTGSAHLLEIGRHRILLDCGFFDSDRLDAEGPNHRLAFDPRSLDAVVVSHAHNDHIGRLPYLIRFGYTGPFYLTPATAAITNVMLRDSARIQREDIRNWNDANPDHEPLEPLFHLVDVEWVVERLRRVPYRTPQEIAEGVTLTFLDAGHILGSALVQLDFQEDGRSRRLVFTGDLGRPRMELLPDPAIVRGIDILISESTYGNRTLDSYDALKKKLQAILARAIRQQGKVVIPAFSLGRTQRMIYTLQSLFAARLARPIPIYVDSPLALRLTEIHREHPEAYTGEARALMDRDPQYFGSKYVEFCASWDDSRRLNYLPGPMIIIGSSGMCEAGRIRHHLKHTLEDPNNAIVIVSYQAEGTLGRQLVDGAEHLEIFDRPIVRRAPVYVLSGFSGHADQNDLRWWFEQTGGSIERAFLVHGEPESMEALKPLLQPFVQTPVELPEQDVAYEA